MENNSSDDALEELPWTLFEKVICSRMAIYASRYEKKSVEASLLKPESTVRTVTKKDKKSKSKVRQRIANLQYTNWCVICGDGLKKDLAKCGRCCVSFHADCIKGELKQKGYDKKSRPPRRSVLFDEGLCNQCTFDEEPCAGDIVWHKLQCYSWWPARILALDKKPDCLINRPSANHLPVKYFGENNHAWADSRQMVSYKMNFAALLKKASYKLKAASEEAASANT